MSNDNGKNDIEKTHTFAVLVERVAGRKKGQAGFTEIALRR